MRIYGLILAGGRSSRFGSDKAIATLAGVPLIMHVARALRASAEALAISGGPEAAAVVDAPLLPDPFGAPQGPLAGILAGLAWAAESDADWLVSATCDVPLIPADMASRLIEVAETKDADLVIARTTDGLHPLCAAWRPQLRHALRRALNDGAHPAVRRFAADMGAVEVLFPRREDFFNINTASDLEIAERYLERAHD